MTMPLPASPIAPMLARSAETLPPAGAVAFEPKWDGFRAIVFRPATDDLLIQSRDLRPLDRYFPDLRAALLRALPTGCIVDGEIVIATPRGLDFDALQLRLHPAASRVARLAGDTPASFVVFDLLAVAGHDIRPLPFVERRALLERLLDAARPPLHLTPMTLDRTLASEWLARFEGAGLDGVIARPLAAPYEAGRRSLIKVKHVRSADCVVGGFRWHTGDEPGLVGSLLLGLHDEAGALQHVGVAAAFSRADRRALARRLEPLRAGAMAGHPWRDWAEGAAHGSGRMPGARSRWSGGKDLSWEPVRPEWVCEVRYDHMQGPRFRHAAHFLRWRPDKAPRDCGYEQLEVTPPWELARVFQGDAGR